MGQKANGREELEKISKEVSQADVALYSAHLLISLKKLVGKHGMPLLAHLIELSIFEAAAHADKKSMSAIVASELEKREPPGG